jgi:uncharacterized membrane protein
VCARACSRAAAQFTIVDGMSDPDQPTELDLPAMESMGPIHMLSIAFPGNRFKGEILPELERLKEERIIRIVDLLFVRKDTLGNTMVTTASDLDWEEAVSFGSYVGALAGFAAAGPEGIERGAMAGAAELADGHLFDEGDVFRVTQALPSNMSAVLVLFEHLWAKPLLESVDRAGGIELSNDWIRPEEVVSMVHRTGPRADRPGPPADRR